MPAGALAAAFICVPGQAWNEDRYQSARDENRNKSPPHPSWSSCDLHCPAAMTFLSQVMYTMDCLNMFHNRKLIEGFCFTYEPPVLRFFMDPWSPWKTGPPVWWISSAKDSETLIDNGFFPEEKGIFLSYCYEIISYSISFILLPPAYNIPVPAFPFLFKNRHGYAGICCWYHYVFFRKDLWKHPPGGGALAGAELVMNLTVPIAIPWCYFHRILHCGLKHLTKPLPRLLAGIVSILLTITIAFLYFIMPRYQNYGKHPHAGGNVYMGGALNFAVLKTDPKRRQQYLHTGTDIWHSLFVFSPVVYSFSGGYKVFLQIFTPLREKRKHLWTYLKGSNQPAKETLRIIRACSVKKLWETFLVIASGHCLSWNRGRHIHACRSGIKRIDHHFDHNDSGHSGIFLEKDPWNPKTFEFGMYFILVFSVVDRILFDIHSLFSRESLNLLAMVGFVLVVSIFLHILLARIFRVEGICSLFPISLCFFRLLLYCRCSRHE